MRFTGVGLCIVGDQPRGFCRHSATAYQDQRFTRRWACQFLPMAVGLCRRVLGLVDFRRGHSVKWAFRLDDIEALIRWLRTSFWDPRIRGCFPSQIRSLGVYLAGFSHCSCHKESKHFGMAIALSHYHQMTLVIGPFHYHERIRQNQKGGLELISHQAGHLYRRTNLR